jgi:hypothetical protein
MNYVQLDSIKTLKLLNWTSCVERQNEVCVDYDQWAWLSKKISFCCANANSKLNYPPLNLIKTQ